MMGCRCTDPADPHGVKPRNSRIGGREKDIHKERERREREREGKFLYRRNSTSSMPDHKIILYWFITTDP